MSLTWSSSRTSPIRRPLTKWLRSPGLKLSCTQLLRFTLRSVSTIQSSYSLSSCLTEWTADPKKDLIDPAVIGTTGILKAIARSAPTVRRVVITSSFAAILDADKVGKPDTVFTEASWNPVTIDNIHESPATAYRASKTLAERAAWDFVGDKKNGVKFDLVTVNPPLVFGPVVHYLAALDSINTSSERWAEILQGKWKEAVPPTGAVFNWVDVRDVATAHVKGGLELPEAGGKRIFTSAGNTFNLQIANIVAKNFPELADKLPAQFGTDEGLDTRLNFDNSASKALLGIEWVSSDTIPGPIICNRT